jgi:hypothetical protein
MIKALLGTEVAILGLSRRNVDLLLSGKPIMVNLAELGLRHQQVILIAGETEESILEDLRAINGKRVPDA